MKFTLERRGICVEPENIQDVAYIEDTLGLTYANSFVRLRRIDKDMLPGTGHFMLKTLRLNTMPEPMTPLVYVCHPYSADPPTNRAKVADIARRLVELHLCPVAPQLYMDSFLNEEKHQDHIMAFCKRLMLACNSVFVFGRSKGCDEEIAFAAASHMIVVRHDCQHCGANTFFGKSVSLPFGRGVTCNACAKKLTVTQRK